MLQQDGMLKTGTAADEDTRAGLNKDDQHPADQLFKEKQPTGGRMSLKATVP